MRAQDDIDRVVAAAHHGLRHHPDPGPALERLRERLVELVDRWHLTLGEVFDGGLGQPVVAVTREGTRAVLKVDRATRSFAAQVATMTAAAGRGYARVLESDTTLGAVLLERLGPSLAEAGLPPAEQVDLLLTPLVEAWRVPLSAVPVGPVDKAAQLAGIIDRLVPELLDAEERTHWLPALDLAHHLALHLSATRDPSREVLCHGDPHQGNALLVPGTAAYRFVDPDGIRAEREYDLGVVLRDFSRELVAEPDPTSAARWHRELCERAGATVGADPERIGQWSFVERVTTGLYLRWFRSADTARSFLDAALVLAPSLEVSLEQA